MRGWIYGVLGCTLAAGNASAESLSSAGSLPSADSPPLEAAVFAGANILPSDNGLGQSYFPDQVPGSSFLVGLRGGYRFYSRFAAELELSYAPSSTPGDSAQGRPGVAEHILGAHAHARYTMLPHAAWRPLVVLGGGIDIALADAPARYGLQVPDVDPVFDWGLGIEHSLGKTLFGLRLDLRQSLAPGVNGVAVGYAVLLSGTYDCFGTGRQERDRLRKEHWRSQALSNDIDGDSIPNGMDLCPEEREVPNGLDEGDGCPEVDTDGDGVLGSRDLCPAAPEDVDGFEDSDGCIDADNDQDGIVDAKDACPLAPETSNGFQDTDGCVDELPDAVRMYTGTIEGIEFVLGSSEIRPEFSSVLDGAVAVFQEYSDLRIEVSGHTDPVGTEPVNIALSRERADKVKWYLVDHGIDPLRLITVGKGTSEPVADNATWEGRIKNRRISFRLVGPEGSPSPSSEAPKPEEH